MNSNTEKQTENEEKFNREKKVKIAKAKQKAWLWPLKVFVLSVALSILFSIASDYFMSATGVIVSVLVVVILIVIAVVVDLVGVAVTVASIESFNSMAARKIKGAREGLILAKNADKVSAICNDVISDICSIISGAAGAVIVGRITASFTNANLVILVSALTSALIAGITISGKSIGKNFAINNCDKIVLFIGKMLSPIWKKDKADKK